MNTFKIYSHNHTEIVSLNNYQKWLEENAPFYFVGPHVTEDNREIYTAYTANLPGAGSYCFTTFEVLMDEKGKAIQESTYHSADWITARDLHRKLLKVKVEKKSPVTINVKAFS